MNELTKQLIAPFIKEIRRSEMPQVAGKDLEEMIAIFEENGIAYTSGDISVSRLKPTQEDYKPDKVKEMVVNLKSNKMVLFPIVVSNDNYIMDGHHRFLAVEKLYGEKSKIPAITIDLPKDKALEMFTKTSDKIEEILDKLNEDPDTVYDNDGNYIDFVGSKTAFPFGYTEDNEIKIGNTESTHAEIDDFYRNFGENIDVPHKYRGRVFADKKIISFWEYPEKDELNKVLKDIENEINRIKTKYSGKYGVEELPEVKFDNSWEIDTVSEEDDDDSGEGPLIPIDTYTGTTEKERERALAKAQTIQHALSPADIRKKKRTATAKKSRAGMTPTQYQQFICTSEGKTSDKIDEIIKEHPDGVYNKKGKRIAAYSNYNGISFGYNNRGDMYIGPFGQTHHEISFFYKKFDSDSYEFAPIDRAYYKNPGRFWPEEKIISFWIAPDKDELNRVLKDIENELKRIHDEYPEIAEDHEIPLTTFGSDWKIDVFKDEDIKKLNDPDYDDDDDDDDESIKAVTYYSTKRTGTQIPIDDYTGQTKKEKERAEAEAQTIQHALSPADIRKKKRTATAKKSRAGMTPTQYQQFICTSEGKMSDKIDETMKEHPDTVYDTEGYPVVSFHGGKPIAFGYNYQGDMYVGGPDDYHNNIANFYSEFDEDAYELAPEGRRDFEFPGRFWPGEKIISFWIYPEKDELKKVLKDIENELKRIHDEYPEVAEQVGLPLVNFDDDWTIDVYKKQDRAKIEPDAETPDTDTDDTDDTDADAEKPQKDPNQLSFGLTKNIVARDTSDRVAGRADYDDETTYDDDDDDDYDDYDDYDSREETGTQIPIDDYTGQTEKEKERSEAQAQAIQHALLPADIRKKKRTATAKELRAGMTPTQYQQFICTSEGKSLADFLVKSLLTETPDGILDKNGNEIVNYDSEAAFPFGYFEGEIKIGNLEGTHGDIWMFYENFKEHAPSNFEFSGRVFVDEKIISFWEYPKKDELNKVLKDIENEINRIKTKYPDAWGVKELPDLKFDDSWKIDITTDEVEKKDIGIQISVDDYTGQTKKEKAIAKVKAQENPHVLSPADIRKKKRIAPTKKLRAGMTPIQYQQFICTSEGKTLADKSLLTEDPDTVYDSEGNVKVEYQGQNEFPFGYNKSEAWIRDRFGFSKKEKNKRLEHAGKMRIGEIGRTHGDIGSLYSYYKEYAGNDRPDFKYAGRVFLDDKIISFWEYPEPEDLQKVLKDIEKESIRIKNKGMQDNIADIKFDDSWTIDIPAEGDSNSGRVYGYDDDDYDDYDDYDSREETGIQIPIKDYTGQTEKEKAVAAAKAQAIQHVLPPGDPRKEKRIATAKELRAGMTPTQYQQFICTSEGISLTEEVILDFLVATDFAKLIKEGSQAASGEVDDGPAMFYRALSKYRDDVIPVAEQAGYIILDYIISKLHKDDFATKFRYEVVPVVSFGSSGVAHTRADNPVAKYREHISPIATSVGFKILDFLGVDLYDIQDGVEVKIPYQFKRDKMLLKYKKGQTFAADTLEESIKRKINGVEFEFIYREHAVEPFFTVLRDGVPVDRMPAHLSKEEMIAFARKNFSKWQADYVKSFGGFVTQIPQQGQTHGVWTGMETKENLIDISVFLD